MLADLKLYLQPELENVRKSVTSEFQLHAGSAYNFININENIFEHLGPMLILAFSKSHAIAKDKARDLAAIVCFILLAHDIHQQNEGSIGLNVLFGDYFYSKFFSYLCKYDLLEWLNELSRLICDLQEAAIIKSQKKLANLSIKELEEVVDKGYANIYGYCCSVGGALIQVDKKRLTSFKRFGKNLGRSFYFSSFIEHRKFALQYLEQAQQDLAALKTLEIEPYLTKLLHHLNYKLQNADSEIAV